MEVEGLSGRHSRRRVASDVLEVPIYRLDREKPHPLSENARHPFTLICTHPLQGAGELHGGKLQDGGELQKGMALIMDKAPELQFLDGWKRDDAANANPDVAAYDGASAAVEGAEFETLESPSDEPSRLRLYWLKEVNWEQNRFTVVPESLGLSPIIGPLRLFGTAALLESGSERGGDLRLCVAAPAFDFLTSHLKYEFGYREMHAPVTVSLSAVSYTHLTLPTICSV